MGRSEKDAVGELFTLFFMLVICKQQKRDWPDAYRSERHALGGVYSSRVYLHACSLHASLTQLAPCPVLFPHDACLRSSPTL